MFQNLKRLFTGREGVSGAETTDGTVTDATRSRESHTRPFPDLRPWEEPSLNPEKRLAAYRDLVREKLEGIQTAFDRARDVGDIATQKEIMNSLETQRWMDEGRLLASGSAQEFCERIDRRLVPGLLGKNFLGTEAWNALGIDVGDAPPLPPSLTKKLVESECSLHPGQKMKDTHILVLIPKTVHGQPYTALKLQELCGAEKKGFARLIHDQPGWAIRWKEQPWASQPRAESEWVWIAKSDPDPGKLPQEKHFRSKDIAEQQQVHDAHYKEYREVRALELMTAALLCNILHEWRLPPYYQRCEESNALNGRVCVKFSVYVNLMIDSCCPDSSSPDIGRALARRL